MSPKPSPLLASSLFVVALVGCAVGAEPDPLGPRARDGGVDDASLEAAPLADTAVEPAEAAPPGDAGVDATTSDVDADMPDTAPPDSGTPDSGAVDSAVPDTAMPDTGAPDTGPPDTGPPDTGLVVCSGAPKVLINEVQLEDPKSSTFKSAELVELYNPNDCAVPLADLELVYKRLAADPSPVARWTGATAGATLPPRGYYVIASTTYVGAWDERFASPYDMDALKGGLALRRGSTIVDALGWGAPSYVEKSPALAPPMGTALARKRSGATPVDNDDNSVDFYPTTTITPGAMNL